MFSIKVRSDAFHKKLKEKHNKQPTLSDFVYLYAVPCNFLPLEVTQAAERDTRTTETITFVDCIITYKKTTIVPTVPTIIS